MKSIFITIINKIFKYVTLLEDIIIKYIIQLDNNNYKTIGISFKIIYSISFICIYMLIYIFTLCIVLCLLISNFHLQKLLLLFKKELLFKVIIFLCIKLLLIYKFIFYLLYNIYICFLIYCNYIIKILPKSNITLCIVLLSLDSPLQKYIINIKKNLFFYLNSFRTF